MVVDETTGEFASARMWPSLVLVEPAATESYLSVSGPGMKTIKIYFSDLDCTPSIEARYEAS